MGFFATHRAVWTLAAPVFGLLAACARGSAEYPIVTAPDGSTGSLQVERVEGGERIVLIELASLTPPERLGPGLREFVVWIEGEHGKPVRAGVLRYDRARRAGNLMAITKLPRFTVKITGERQGEARAPSSVVLAERKIDLN